MKQNNHLANVYAFILGIFVLIEGIWGLFSMVVFGFFATNTTHAIIHIVLGIAGIWFSLSGNPQQYCFFMGFLLLIVGILRFIPGINELVIKILNVNYPVAYLNISIGIVSLIVAMISKPKTVKASQTL